VECGAVWGVEKSSKLVFLVGNTQWRILGRVRFGSVWSVERLCGAWSRVECGEIAKTRISQGDALWMDLDRVRL
jgi:hypothetical protein